MPTSLRGGRRHASSCRRAWCTATRTTTLGQPEWDLTLTAVHHECGWHPLCDYAAFVNAYGYDVRTAPAWPVLKAIRMLRMTT